VPLAAVEATATAALAVEVAMATLPTMKAAKEVDILAAIALAQIHQARAGGMATSFAA
jgi:hypothetical protein